ncbi:MAG: pyruvoyl-dependent arginine decarboxylase [bacterium]|nr:pyruvoyl-dependent arginine decarboxylase [bacterium]
MDIFINAGVGTGKTLLSAFDGALQDAGVYNYNLITLSSVIPPRSHIQIRKFQEKKDEFGYKLYVVKSEVRSGVKGTYIGAAIGWYQKKDGSGLFVEHHEEGKTALVVKSKLEKDVYASLSDLCERRRFAYSKKQCKIHLIARKVEDTPMCVLVLAVYQSEGWK